MHFRKANLTLDHKKCRFMINQASYLGHTTTDTIKPQGDKVKPVADYASPKPTKQVKSFKGMCSFFKHFKIGFSLITEPLFNLTKQDVKCQWAKECYKAFDTLKNKLETHPVLILHMGNKSFQIFSDTSENAIGYMLMREFKERYIQ